MKVNLKAIFAKFAIFLMMLSHFPTQGWCASGKSALKRSTSQEVSSEESGQDWKGLPNDQEIAFGALTGVGIINYSLGFGLLATVSKRIVKHGFIRDINNSVWIEGMVGPVLGLPYSAWSYSTHLRWDFSKDQLWTLYAVGGVGGNVISATAIPTSFRLAPRFGVGALYKIQEKFYLRGEVSQDFIVAGAYFPF